MRFIPAILIGILLTILAALLVDQVSAVILLGGALAFFTSVLLLGRLDNFPMGAFILALFFATIAMPVFRGLLFIDVVLILLIIKDLRKFTDNLPEKLLGDPIIFGILLYTFSALIGDMAHGFYSGVELLIDMIRWGTNLLFYLYARTLFIKGDRRLFNVVAIGLASTVLLSTPVSLYESMVGKVYDFRAFLPGNTSDLVRFELNPYTMVLRPAGLFNNANMTAVQMAFFLPWCISGFLENRTRNGLKLFFLCAIIGNLISVLLTASRGGILATAIVLFAYFALARQKGILLTWGLAGIFTLLFLSYAGLIPGSSIDPLKQIELRFSQIGDSDFNTSSRIELNVLALRMWTENPIFGTGMGRFAELVYARTDVSPTLRRMLEYKGKGIANHNSYTQIPAEAGLVGVIGMLFALAGGARSVKHMLQLKKIKHESYNWSIAIAVSILAFLLGSMTGDFIPQRNIWFIFGIASGYSTALLQKGQENVDDLQPEQAAANRLAYPRQHS